MRERLTVRDSREPDRTNSGHRVESVRSTREERLISDRDRSGREGVERSNSDRCRSIREEDVRSRMDRGHYDSGRSPERHVPKKPVWDRLEPDRSAGGDRRELDKRSGGHMKDRGPTSNYEERGPKQRNEDVDEQ